MSEDHRLRRHPDRTRSWASHFLACAAVINSRTGDDPLRGSRPTALRTPASSSRTALVETAAWRQTASGEERAATSGRRPDQGAGSSRRRAAAPLRSTSRPHALRQHARRQMRASTAKTPSSDVSRELAAGILQPPAIEALVRSAGDHAARNRAAADPAADHRRSDDRRAPAPATTTRS